MTNLLITSKKTILLFIIFMAAFTMQAQKRKEILKNEKKILKEIIQKKNKPEYA